VKQLLMVLLAVLILVCLTGCARDVRWVDRPTPEVGNKQAVTPVPTCPHCKEYADWESDLCKNPKCGKAYSWTEPEILK